MSGQQPAADSGGAAPVTLLRVEHGSPDAHELAALTVVMAALASTGGDEPPPPAPNGWGSRWRSFTPRRVRGRAWGCW